MPAATPSNPRAPPRRKPTKDWAEEIWTVTLAAPIILAFVPGMSKTDSNAFTMLSQAPTWYQSAVAASILFTFGTRTDRGVRSLLHRSPPTSSLPLAIPAGGITSGGDHR